MAYIQDRISRELPVCAAKFLDYLNKAEQSLGVPIRLLDPRESRDKDHAAETAWSGDSAELSHYSSADDEATLKEKGITIYQGSFASFHREFVLPREWTMYLPESVAIEGREGYNVELWNNWPMMRMPCRQQNSGGELGLHERIEGAGGAPLVSDETKDAVDDGDISGRYTYGEMYHEGRVVFLYGTIEGPLYVIPDWDQVLFDKIAEYSNPEICERRAREREEETRNIFNQLMQDQGDAALTEVRGRIDELMVATACAEETAANGKITLQQLQRQLDILIEQNGELTDEMIANEWNSITGNANVEKWEIKGRQNRPEFHLYTKEMFITNPRNGRKMPLGKFLIKMNMNDNWLRIKNLTNPQGERGHMDHPHVRDERICAGSYETTIITMLRRRQLAGMTNMLVNILSSVDPADDYGRRITAWEDADDELRRQNGWDAWTRDETQHPMEVAANA